MQVMIDVLLGRLPHILRHQMHDTRDNVEHIEVQQEQIDSNKDTEDGVPTKNAITLHRH